MFCWGRARRIGNVTESLKLLAIVKFCLLFNKTLPEHLSIPLQTARFIFPSVSRP